MEARIGREAERLLANNVSLHLRDGATVHFNHRTGKSSKGADLYFSIKAVMPSEKTLQEDACDKESVVTTLNKTLGGTSFTRAFLNPPGHLCLNLNRPIIILRTLTQVAGEGNQYGFTRSHAQGTLISLVYCPCAIRCAADYGTVSSSLSDRAGSGCGSECHQGGVLSMEEGRVCVLAGVLSNILHECGYDVHQSNPCVRFEGHNDMDTFASCFFSCKELGLKALKDNPVVSVKDFISVLATHPYLVPPEKGGAKGRSVDANQFLTDQHLVGKGSRYDKNIKHIQITDADKNPTVMSWLAFEGVTRLEQSQEPDGSRHGRRHITCHMTHSNKHFLILQSLVLGTMYESGKGREISVHSVISCGGVEYVSDGGGRGSEGNKGNEARPSLSDVMRIRTDQVSSLYAVRYPELFQGGQLQVVSSKIARAVVLFELLSVDLHKLVKIKLPRTETMATPSMGVASEDPSAKAPNLPCIFILYNYARISCILRKHQQQVVQGVYPPLPPVHEVDFSLLTNEVEWQLLYHFVLHFPTVIAEAVKIRTQEEGRAEEGAREGVAPLISVDISINKICLFLVNLAHCFSSYYCQTKILMSPEPHLLALIHARLHLATAIKQVMLNALLLLGITPLDEL